jgi:hypothetical protein
MAPPGFGQRRDVVPQGLEPRLLARGVLETLELLGVVLLVSGIAMWSPRWRPGYISMTGLLRLAAVVLLLATGAANALFGYVTPWPINGAFGEDDGQYLAIPIGVAHATIALLLVVAGLAGAIGRHSWPLAIDRFAAAVTLVWCVWSVGVWTLMTWSAVLQIPKGLTGQVYGQAPGDPLVPLALLVAPLMAIAYLVAAWAVFPRRARIRLGAAGASQADTDLHQQDADTAAQR